MKKTSMRSLQGGTNSHALMKKKTHPWLLAALGVMVMTCALLASFWTSWQEYGGNPVFDPQVRAYYPSVLYDASAFSGHGNAAHYKMWFARGDGIAFASGDDGIHWNEYNASASLTGLASGANHPVVLYDAGGFEMPGNGYYRMWYWDANASLGSIGAIRSAFSADGIVWQNDQPIQQHASDPTLQLLAGYGVFGNYFYHCYGPGCVVYSPSATNIGAATPADRSDDQPTSWRYLMYFDSSSEGFSPNGSVEQTSLAYSSDGLFWIRYGDQPVLLPSGNPAEWDGLYAYRASVIRIENTWHLWYSGANGNDAIGTPYAHGIGHAASVDGLNWVRDSDNPALHVSDGIPWRSVRTYTPAVLYDPNRFSGHGDACLLKMLFSGRDSENYAIGYAAICPSDNPPVAEITGPAPPTRVGDTIALGGGSSYDPDGDPIDEWQWEIQSRPAGSVFPPPENSRPDFSFVPDAEGIYTICLRVRSQGSHSQPLWSQPACLPVVVRGYNYCNCPETNLHVDVIEDRMWFKSYHIAQLTWTVTTVYPACSISGFRVYRRKDGTWQKLADLPATVFAFEDRGVWADPEYQVVPLRSGDGECTGRQPEVTRFKDTAADLDRHEKEIK